MNSLCHYLHIMSVFWSVWPHSFRTKMIVSRQCAPYKFSKLRTAFISFNHICPIVFQEWVMLFELTGMSGGKGFICAHISAVGLLGTIDSMPTKNILHRYCLSMIDGVLLQFYSSTVLQFYQRFRPAFCRHCVLKICITEHQISLSWTFSFWSGQLHKSFLLLVFILLDSLCCKLYCISRTFEH